MATALAYSDIATIQNAPTIETLNDATKVGGKLRVARGKYTAAVETSIGARINLCKLPKGARVIPELSQFKAGEFTTNTATITIGDDDDNGDAQGAHAANTADADRYMVADVMDAADATYFPLNGVPNIAAAACVDSYKLGSEAWIYATLGVAVMAIGDNFDFTIVYTIE